MSSARMIRRALQGASAAPARGRALRPSRDARGGRQARPRASAGG